MWGMNGSPLVPPRNPPILASALLRFLPSSRAAFVSTSAVSLASSHRLSSSMSFSSNSAPDASASVWRVVLARRAVSSDRTWVRDCCVNVWVWRAWV